MKTQVRFHSISAAPASNHPHEPAGGAGRIDGVSAQVDHVQRDPAPLPLFHGREAVAGVTEHPVQLEHDHSARLTSPDSRQETLTALGPGLAYSRLLRLRTGPLVEQPSLLLECDLCQSWRLDSDFAYEFQLRPDVEWQNLEPVNGRALVASDLVYSYQRMQTPGWANATLFPDRGISEFEALDDHTLRVKLAFLDSDALLPLADGHSKIVAHEVVELKTELERIREQVLNVE